MISSEVQRTLVKSPPELWAELSDPASLGRHLGELGEIRITRIEPEHKVEWEAGDTSGTVQIKPSGWGTRVTLTATRELPEAGVAPAAPGEVVVVDPAAPGPAAVAYLAAATGPGEVADPAAAAPGEVADPAPAEVGDWETLTATDASAPLSERVHADPQPEGAEETAPAAEAETPLRAGDQPAFAPQTPAAAFARRGQAHEVELDRSPGPEPEPEAEAPGDAEGVQPGRFDWLAYEADQPQPRRGFFARLFGRRRRPEPEPLDELAAIGPPGEPPEEIAAADAPLEADEPQLQADEPQPEADVPPPEADVPQQQAEELQLQADEPQHQADEPQLPAEEPPHDKSGVPLETGEVPLKADDAISSPEPLDAQPYGGIAAEEGVKADVTAVLTSVLDRLGAAHHRPFSRS